MIQIQDNISEQKNLKDKLESEQEKLHMEYNKVSSKIPTYSNLHSIWFMKQTECFNKCQEGTCQRARSYIYLLPGLSLSFGFCK